MAAKQIRTSFSELSVLIILLIGVIPFAVQAEKSSNSKPAVNQPVMNDPFAQLNLTADQQKKMVEIQQNFRTDNQSLLSQLQKTQLQLQQLWGANPLT